MGYEELNGRYQRLRTELDAAYTGPVWNSRRIDEIAAEISQIEFALASAQPAKPGRAAFDGNATDRAEA